MSAAEPNVFEEPAAGGTPAPAPEAAPKRRSVSQWSEGSLLRCFRMLNILNGLLLIFGAIIVFIAAIVTVSFATITVAAYECAFGLMMTCVEMNIANIQPRLRKNCGFLFTFMGRALFIIFAGTMTIAMESWISWIVGGLTIANGLFNGYAMCVHPAFRKGGRLHAHADPFKGMSTGEREVAEYLKRNPDMAVRVGATAANVARNNPELAQQAMRGAASSAAAPAPAPAAAAPAPAASSSPFGGSPTAGDDENPFA